MTTNTDRTKGLSGRIVDEIVRTVEVALGRHIEAERDRQRQSGASRQGARWIGERYGLGMAATYLRGKLLTTVIQHELSPIIGRPLNPGVGYTAAAKVDELLVTVGALCIVLGCNPLSGPRLRELRMALGRLLSA